MTGMRVRGSIKVTTPRGTPAQPMRIQVPEWVSSAAVCSQVGGDLFWVDPGGNTNPAKDLCRSCPLIEPCLEDAMGRAEFGGVWGGTDEKDRRRLRARKGKAPAAKCGTASGYFRHVRTLGEAACEACLVAHRAASAVSAAKTRDRQRRIA